MSRHRAGGGHRQAKQVYLAGGIAHAAYEVAVGRGQCALSGRKNPHVSAQARAARGGRDGGVRVQEDIEQPFVHGLPVDILGSRDDDEAHVLVNLAPLEDARRDAQVLDAPVRTAADDDLVDPDVASFDGGSGRVLLGRCGKATVGTIVDASEYIPSGEEFTCEDTVWTNGYNLTIENGVTISFFRFSKVCCAWRHIPDR